MNPKEAPRQPMQIETEYEIDENLLEELQKRFTYHRPKGDQPARYEALREQYFQMSILICKMCPPTRERSLALTKLEESVMHANSSIARNE